MMTGVNATGILLQQSGDKLADTQTMANKRDMDTRLALLRSTLEMGHHEFFDCLCSSMREIVQALALRELLPAFDHDRIDAASEVFL